MVFCLGLPPVGYQGSALSFMCDHSKRLLPAKDPCSWRFCVPLYVQFTKEHNWEPVAGVYFKVSID